MATGAARYCGKAARYLSSTGWKSRLDAAKDCRALMKVFMFGSFFRNSASMRFITGARFRDLGPDLPHLLRQKKIQAHAQHQQGDERGREQRPQVLALLFQLLDGDGLKRRRPLLEQIGLLFGRFHGFNARL